MLSLDWSHVKVKPCQKQAPSIKLYLCNDVVVCDFSSSYLEALEQDIMTSWESYSSANEAKSMLRSLRTPITLFSCFMLFYMLSGNNDS